MSARVCVCVLFDWLMKGLAEEPGQLAGTRSGGGGDKDDGCSHFHLLP